MKTEQQEQGSSSKAQHTSGKWQHCLGSFGPYVVAQKPGSDVMICKAHYSMTPDIGSEEENAANVRLIAAAPELLEAAKMALATIERLAPSHGGFDSTRGTKDVICAAIAKAEGRA